MAWVVNDDAAATAVAGAADALSLDCMPLHIVSVAPPALSPIPHSDPTEPDYNPLRCAAAVRCCEVKVLRRPPPARNRHVRGRPQTRHRQDAIDASYVHRFNASFSIFVSLFLAPADVTRPT